jgi:uncharacterized membrane protein
MGNYDAIGKAVENLFKIGAVLLCIFVPLGLWKLIEIIIWIYQRINVVIK